MIYIRTENTEVVLKHYAWNHPEHGLGRTKEELEQTGYFVESIPEESPQEGYIQKLHYTADDGFWFEYVERTKENNYGLSDEQLEEIKQDYREEIAMEVQANA